MILVLLELLGWLTCAVAAAVVASDKGRSPIIWFMLGVLLGPIGLLLSFLPRPRPEIVEGRARSIGLLVPCPACGKDVWAKAPACPHCGEALRAADRGGP